MGGKSRQTLACMDSGVGGLAVLSRLVQQLPHCPYIFIGDTAWMPYGEKPLSAVQQRVLQVHRWINQTFSLAAFILACNTATVAAYDELEAMNLPYPVLEPVKTTAQWINQHVPSGKKIGILATPGTVTGGRYLRFLDSSWEVKQIPCPGLASAIETGICKGPQLESVLLPYLSPLLHFQADVIVLGCTHYSLIRQVIQNHASEGTLIVDSAEVLALNAIPIIQSLNLGQGAQDMMVTGDAGLFRDAISRLPLEQLQHKAVLSVALNEELPLG